MYSLNASNLQFGFNNSSSFSPQSGDLFLVPTGNCIDDNPIFSSLQHNSPSVLPSQQQPFTQYLPQTSINLVNSAYMQQESCIAFLQDCCNVLEWHLVKVTTEHDTIKILFDKLTNVVNSGMCNPSLLGSNLPLLLMTAGEKPPMCETHPKVWFWTRKDYEDWLDSPEAGGSNHGLYAYLEDENSDVPTSEMLPRIQRALCAGWIELTQCKIAPDTWGSAHTEKDFPLFKLVESGWKLKHLCTKTYLAWRTKNLDDHGNLKRTTHDVIKGEALDDDNNLKSLPPGSKKCKGPMDTSLMLSNKKQKSTAALQPWDPSESLKFAAPDSSSMSMSTSTSTSMLTSLGSAACIALPIQELPEYPAETASAQLTPQDVGAALANKENNPSIDNANILTTTKNPIEFTCNGCREGQHIACPSHCGESMT
ncbi:hypothetical protein F5J12DRAFT_785352 [Pisolithus orientalis]|uniref:uncharacterized protein n=1 Tax=Pisolithus orientalis TaxID=936130 RepID=UPI002224EA88|nr:uncharacterized protein F5J12DRAFT_785352 [Pisolithus orientalis]KAI5996557.1 hypothetical protein F5J12DRAFT_785352 [Pisolithus orientalis]